MKAADLWNGNNLPSAWRRHGAWQRRIFIERQMRASSFVVVHVPGQRTLQARGSEDDHVIETLASDRSDEPFDHAVLPRRSRRRQHFSDRHRLRSLVDRREREIPIADQEAPRVVPGKYPALLCRSRWRRACAVTATPSPAALVRQHDQDRTAGRWRVGIDEELLPDHCPRHRSGTFATTGRAGPPGRIEASRRPGRAISMPNSHSPRSGRPTEGGS